MPSNTLRIITIICLILLIPLVLTIRDGGIEGVGWNWTIGDFIVMGTLLFVTGLAIDWVLRRFPDTVHRVIGVTFIVLSLLVLWAELAVDAVSQLFARLFG